MEAMVTGNRGRNISFTVEGKIICSDKYPGLDVLRGDLASAKLHSPLWADLASAKLHLPLWAYLASAKLHSLL